MSHLTGVLVKATDYNNYVGDKVSTVATEFNALYAIGNSNLGYGQKYIPKVSSAEKVTASEWRELIINLNNVANHQGTSLDPMTLPLIGSTIAIDDSINTPIASAIGVNLNRLYSNRNNTAAQGAIDVSTSVSNQTFSDKIIFNHVITFESGDQARYFFNAGGQVALNFVHPSGTGINELWNRLTSACGTLTLSAQSSGIIKVAGNSYTGLTRTNGSGSPNILLTNSGYFSLSSTSTTVFKQFATVGPSDSLLSYIDVSIQTNGNAQLNGDVGNVLYITTSFVQVSSGTNIVSGIGSGVTCTVRSPSSTYLTNSWGPVGISSYYEIRNSIVVVPPIVLPPPPPPAPPDPSTYTLEWSNSQPAFGSSNTLTARLNEKATFNTTLSIPYLSLISGVSSGSLSIVVPTGQYSGSATLSLSSQTVINYSTNIIKARGAHDYLTTDKLSYIAVGMKVYPPTVTRLNGHYCVEVSPTMAVVRSQQINTYTTPDSLYTWLTTVASGNIIAIATSLLGVLNQKSRDYLTANFGTTNPAVFGSANNSTTSRVSHALIATRGGKTAFEAISTITPVEVEYNVSGYSSGASTTSSGRLTTTVSSPQILQSPITQITLTLKGENPTFDILPKLQYSTVYVNSKPPGSWSQTMKDYSVWPVSYPPGGAAPAGQYVLYMDVTIPTSGEYAIQFLADNYGKARLDNSYIYKDNPGFAPDSVKTGTVLSYTSPYLHRLTAGKKVLTLIVENAGGGGGNPAGVAFVIYNVVPASSLLTANRTATNIVWSTRSNLTP